MRTVWRYDVPSGMDYFDLEMPVGSTILEITTREVANDGFQWSPPLEQASMWVFVPDTDAEKERRYFRVAGTGHAINEEQVLYWGSFQQLQGALIFHVFEIGG